MRQLQCCELQNRNPHRVNIVLKVVHPGSVFRYHPQGPFVIDLLDLGRGIVECSNELSFHVLDIVIYVFAAQTKIDQLKLERLEAGHYQVSRLDVSVSDLFGIHVIEHFKTVVHKSFKLFKVQSHVVLSDVLFKRAYPLFHN